MYALVYNDRAAHLLAANVHGRLGTIDDVSHQRRHLRVDSARHPSRRGFQLRSCVLHKLHYRQRMKQREKARIASLVDAIAPTAVSVPHYFPGLLQANLAGDVLVRVEFLARHCRHGDVHRVPEHHGH